MPLPIKMTGFKDRPVTVVEKIAQRFEVIPSGCWQWRGYVSTTGYALYSSKFVHRIMWELTGNPVDLSLQLDHLCRNRACINPKHLEQVTSKENTMRGTAFTAVNAKKEVCIYGHPLSGSNLYIKPRPGRADMRQCVKCQQNAVLKHSASKKAKAAALDGVIGEPE